LVKEKKKTGRHFVQAISWLRGGENLVTCVSKKIQFARRKGTGKRSRRPGNFPEVWGERGRDRWSGPLEVKKQRAAAKRYAQGRGK